MRRYVLVFLVLIVFLSTAVVTYAGSDVQADTLDRGIVINGVNVVNYCTDCPYFEYDSTIYAPLAEENCNILGLSIIREETDSIVLKETAPIQVNYQSSDPIPAAETITATVSMKNVEILTSDGTGGYISTVLTDQMTEGKPILEYDGVIYIPLTDRVVELVLQWGQVIDDKSSKVQETEAVSDGSSNGQLTYNVSGTSLVIADSAYNRALANYIISVNKSYTTESAMQMVAIIRSAAEANGVDPRLVMAIIQTESTFKNVTSSGGAIGYMQIMPATGRGYGLSVSDLRDPVKNINFGSMYIGNNIKKYGNVEKALVAYNQGGLAVQRGTTSSKYSRTIVSRYNAIVAKTEGL